MGRYAYLVEGRNVINCVSCHLLVSDRPPCFQIFFFLLHGILKTIYLFSLSLFPFISTYSFFIQIPLSSFTYSFWFLTFFICFYFLLFFIFSYFSCFYFCLLASFRLDLIFELFFLYSVASSFVLFRSILFSQSKFVRLQLSSGMSFAFNVCTVHTTDGGGEDADSSFSYLFLICLRPILVANFT